MKIVINNCFGGFGISDEGFELYLKKKGVKFYKEEGFLGSSYYTVPPEKYHRLSEKWSKEDGDYRRINSKNWYLSYRDIERTDPILIEVIKELKNKASENFAKLEIIEIPDNQEYEINDYDGLETVYSAEKLFINGKRLKKEEI